MNAVGQGVKLIGWRGQLLKSAKVGRGHASRSDAKWSKSSDKMKRREGGGRRRTNLLLAFLVIWPLTTHPFRDGAAVLLLMETPPTFGLTAFFSCFSWKLFACRFPFLFRLFWLTSTGISYRCRFVFSLLSSMLNLSMSHGVLLYCTTVE